MDTPHRPTSLTDRVDQEPRLKPEWEVKSTQDNRLYYLNHMNKSSHWLPPKESWTCSHDLPYGWEMAIDKNEREYFLNHLTEKTSRRDPRREDQNIGDSGDRAREVSLERDENFGFGFIAGSEKPVLVRSVIEGGPAEGKLFSGDCIVSVNGEDVETAQNATVIELIKTCRDKVILVVASKPTKVGEPKKSSFLNKAEKARRKDLPLKVRFADPLFNAITPSVPVGRNVFRVFLENGQIRTMKFSELMTVGEVIDRLCEKLALRATRHFSLMLESPDSSQLVYLPNHCALANVDQLRNKSWKCRLRVRLMMKDVMQLLKIDPNAFDYLFAQTCNDVVNGRFGCDLTNDAAIKLGALHMQQQAVRDGPTNKISIKTMERECGLQRFLPEQVIINMKTKELRKMISHCVKLNQLMSLPGERHLTDIQAKLLYLKIAGGLKAFGGKYYTAKLEREQSEITVLVSPQSGFCHVVSRQRNLLRQFADFPDLTLLTVKELDARHVQLSVGIKDKDTLNFVMNPTAAVDMANLLDGYFCLFTKQKSLLPCINDPSTEANKDVPPYCSIHTVLASSWSYSSSVTDKGNTEECDQSSIKCVLDLSQPPPKYEKRSVSPFPIKLRETGINLVEDSWLQSRRSEDTDSNIQRRMMPRGPCNVDDIPVDDQGEEVVARKAAEAAAERAVCRLKRASFTHSPPPSPELINGIDQECQELENEDREDSVEDLFLPESLTASVFDDDTIYMDGEDDTLQTLLDSVNRTRSAHRAKHLQQFDPWADTGEITLWEDDNANDLNEEMLSDINGDWEEAESIDGSDIHFAVVEDLPDELLAPPPEFQDGFEPLPEFVPPPEEFDLSGTDPNLDGMLLPPPSGFDSRLSPDMLHPPEQEDTSSLPPEFASLSPPDFNPLSEGFVSSSLSSAPHEEISPAPPEEFASSTEVVEESHPPKLPPLIYSVSVEVNLNTTAVDSSRQSIVLTENIPDWLRMELEEPHVRTNKNHLQIDAEDDGDEESLLPATVTSIDDFEVENVYLQQQEFAYIPSHQLPLPCELPPLLEVDFESELMEQMDFDVPPPVIEQELVTDTTENSDSEEAPTSPPPVPTTPIPDEVSNVKETTAKNKEGEEQGKQEEEEEDRGPSIVPVSEKTARVLTSSSMFGTSLRTSSRRVPPPMCPRPRSATSVSREHRQASDVSRTGPGVSQEKKERPSSAGSARSGKLSKTVPKVVSHLSPKLSQQKKSPKVVLKSYTKHSDVAGPIETMSSSQVMSSTPPNVHSNTQGKRPSTKRYKAPLPPVEQKEGLEQGNRQSKSSNKHRALAPPSRKAAVSVAQDSPGDNTSPESSQRATKSSHDYPILHPHPWLPPSPGESKHIHTSPQASPGRRQPSASPKKSASQSAPVGTTSPSQKKKKGSSGVSSTDQDKIEPNVTATTMDGSQEQDTDVLHDTASSYDESPVDEVKAEEAPENEAVTNETSTDKARIDASINEAPTDKAASDEADSAPPLPDSPPPPLPSSLPPDEDLQWSQAVTSSCRSCIESLSGVLMSLDMSLQNIMSTSCDPHTSTSDDLDFDSVKSTLVSEAKTLSQQTKAIVSVVVQQHEKIPEIEGALETVTSLADSCCQCVEILTAKCSNFPLPDIRQTLLVAVMDVVGAFRQMISATADAVSAGLEEKSVLLLMDRAKAMASIMASLMRSLSQVKEQV